MASEKKKSKLKNSYCVPSALKNKLPHKCRRLLFYTSSQRQQEKQEVQLTKAKDVIEKLLNAFASNNFFEEEELSAMEEAEQFLKEVDHD